MNALRRTLAIISLWIPTVTIWVTWAMWRDRLPADLPTHWGSSGPADDVTLGTTYFAWIVGVTAVIAVLGSVMLLIPMRGRWAQRAIGGMASGAAAMALGIWLGSTVPSLDVVDPFSVHLGAWVLVVTLAPLYGLVTLALLPFGVRPPVKVNPASSVSAMHLEPGESVAWSRSITSPLFIGTAIFVATLTALITLPQVLGGRNSRAWLDSYPNGYCDPLGRSVVRVSGNGGLARASGDFVPSRHPDQEDSDRRDR